MNDMEKLKEIKLLLLDVDGVLTDGSIMYDDARVEIKRFNVKDGLGIKLLMNAGIQVGIVTGRSSESLYHRCKDLGITLIYDGIQNKAAAFETILSKNSAKKNEIAYMGDDLTDLPLCKKVGVFIAVADAHEMVRDNADIITSAAGGKGAVREICESILNARGLWETVANSFR